MSPAGKPSVIINCIVTSGSLVPSIAKRKTHRQDDVVSSDNTYVEWGMKLRWPVDQGVVQRAKCLRRAEMGVKRDKRYVRLPCSDVAVDKMVIRRDAHGFPGWRRQYLGSCKPHLYYEAP